MKKLAKICTTCRKPKKEDCTICKPKPFENINKENHSFYNSYAWRKLSKQFKKENPLCIQCLQNGRTTPTNITDHIKPIDKGGNKWDLNNLQPLCHQCHNRKSGRSK